MANLNQNEICAVLCLKRQYKIHDGEKWLSENNIAHSQFIKLSKSSTNTNSNFHSTCIASEGEGNQPVSYTHLTLPTIYSV